MSVLNDGVIDRTDGNGQPQAYKIDKDFGNENERQSFKIVFAKITQDTHVGISVKVMNSLY